MASIYKKFTAQDFAIIPFNAHKQYNFVSSSASGNSINHYNTRWTSESISNYSTHPLSASVDTINAIKYNQINHLFYKHFMKNPSRVFEDVNYLTHHRVLYEKTNILSLPTGLYGYEIKPGSFYVSSSKYQVVDDNNGNLIIQGTNTDNYPTDKRQNIFKLEPTEGFKAYDLGVFKGYAVFRYDQETKDKFYTRKFYRRGERNPNASSHYSTPSGIFDIDDSYHFNNIKYYNAQFQSSTLGSTNHKFPSIYFDSVSGSYIMSPHHENFNFSSNNQDDDFSISFFMEPKPIGNSSQAIIGNTLGGGTIFHIDSNYIYVASLRTEYMEDHVDGWGPNGIGLSASDNTMGGGLANTNAMKNHPLTNQGNTVALNLPNVGGYSDWWLANQLETHTILSNLLPKNPTLIDDVPLQTLTSPEFKLFITSLEAPGAPGANNFQTGFIYPTDGGGTSPFGYVDNNGIPRTASFKTNHSISKLNQHGYNNKHYFVVRRIALNTLDSNTEKRYILSKSTTKTVVPKAQEGKSAIQNIKLKGNMQPLDTQSEPQFPFEIYMISQSLYFDRSDGDNTISVSCLVTGSNKTVLNTSHILCQKTGSLMEIYFNGNLITSGSTSNLSQTRNTANLYVGSKGKQSIADSGKKSQNRFFNGTLTNLNIWDRTFSQIEVTNISESINASPYIGNIFYNTGITTITHPKYYDIVSNGVDGIINTLQFQGSHLIWEHEFQCTIGEHEFNSTYNTTVRDQTGDFPWDFANFTTSSFWKPYITTIGLYNDAFELVAIAKLGQPIRCSDETDTTLVVRFDT